ncbi:MAG TPA: elongation factor G [Acholeplasmataceae bacterium]|nr:elongation factor G [Acholeplasmataceae bacterium]
MKEYKTKNIKNIAILGHSGSGKTSLGEAILFEAGAISKKGSVERKNTIGDYLFEEQARQTTLISSLMPIEWKDYKINLFDTPGSDEFIGDLENVLSVVDGAVLLIDASKGVEVGTEAYWNELKKRSIPTIIVVNKMDKENIKFDEVIQEIKVKLSPKAVPFSWPLGRDDKFDGFANVITKKARIYVDGKYHDEEIYPDKVAIVEELYAGLLEKVAETSEELLEKFFSGEELTQEEVRNGLLQGSKDGDVYPIAVASVSNHVGISSLLDMMMRYLPDANVKGEVKGKDLNGASITRKIACEEPFSGQVFKTTIDPFVGSIAFVKINSGKISTGIDVYIPELDESFKVPPLFTMMGNNQILIDCANAGDVICLAKIDDLRNGMTISDKKAPIIYEKITHPTPILYIAITPKNRQDEDKLSSSLSKLSLEDETFETKRNPETKQLLLGGQGTLQLAYIMDRMKNTYKVELEVSDPKIVYRESIRGKAEAQGRHKKQSGGAGQFGEVYIRFETTEENFEFASEVVGGSVPKNYFPAVEKGLIEVLEHGPLAGFPVVNVRAVLYDGSYHPVDSNEISFRLAAALAWKNAVPNLKPTILEPIYKVSVVVKDEFVGDIMGDMTKRRGRVLGLEQNDGSQIIIAEVPEAEIIKYATDLKAMTQASGRFSREFIRYDYVPEILISKIVEEYKVER